MKRHVERGIEFYVDLIEGGSHIVAFGHDKTFCGLELTDKFIRDDKLELEEIGCFECTFNLTSERYELSD